MNILIVIYEFPPVGGGAGKAVMNFCKSYNNHENSIDVVTSSSEAYEEFTLGFANIYTVPVKRRSVHETGLYGMLIFLLRAYLRIKKLQKEKKYDLIHYYLSIPTGILSLLLNKSIPYIISLRGGDVPGYNPGQFQILHRLLLPVNKRIWKKAAAVITVSDDLGKKAQKSYKQLKHTVIHNGVDINLFYPDEHKKSKNKITLLCVTRLVPWKGVDTLLKAMSKITHIDCELIIVGTGPFEKKLLRMHKSLKLEGKVDFIGYIPHNELRHWYNKSDIFVLPSNGDSFGNVFCEAMACGLPVIAAACGGVQEFVVEGENGYLVEPNNSNMLAEKIKYLAVNKEIRLRMLKANVVKMKELFSWEAVCKKQTDVYDEILKGKIIKK